VILCFSVDLRDSVLCRFEDARRDPMFDHVKNRKENFHCRCTQCALFSARFNKGFATTAEKREWEAKKAAHEKE
jgi:hypothetical protein